MQLPPRLGGNYQQLAHAIHQIAHGGGNNTGSFTLDADSSTTVLNQDMSENAFVFFVPLTANAAQAWINLDAPFYLSARANGSFTVTHAASADGDRTFAYVILGV